MSDEKKRWIGTQLDEDTHSALCARAAERGMHPVDLVAQYVQRGLTEDSKDTGSIELRVYGADQRARKRERQYTQLCRIALAYLKDQTEEGYEELNALCDASGVILNDLFEDVRRMTAGGSLPDVDDGDKMGAVMRWLQETLTSQKQLPFLEIQRQAELHGYSMSMVRAAKSKLGVKSVRVSCRWLWKIEQPAGASVTLQHDVINQTSIVQDAQQDASQDVSQGASQDNGKVLDGSFILINEENAV